MKMAVKSFAVLMLATCVFATPIRKKSVGNTPLTRINAEPRIQVAILLDVSNSMDGLIDQAKAQLWNMVSVMGKAKCNGIAPKIEIALYEYGRSTNDLKLGYVKQISAFSGDLDKLSNELFSLKTNGGDEFCGHVIYTSMNELAWDPSPDNYKVVFIAGNEDFLQGDIIYTKACDEAKKKGVIVNTIYCGDRLQGIREHWNLGAECGNGSFTNIDQDAKQPEIPTPYDSTLFVLNDRLNKTYIYYGDKGLESMAGQGYADVNNLSVSKPVAAQRIAVKGNQQLYNNASWDLLDAVRADSNFVSKVDMKTLPDSLQKKSRKELERIVKDEGVKRSSIQNQITDLSSKRDVYMAKEKAKAATNNENVTLETAIERIIKEQAGRFKMIIK